MTRKKKLKKIKRNPHVFSRIEFVTPFMVGCYNVMCEFLFYRKGSIEQAGNEKNNEKSETRYM